MRRLLLTISYIGTDFCGWQVQPNGITVQEVLGKAVTEITGEKVNITGCSRTDSGVHANMFCCHLDLEKDISEKKIISALNAVLPKSIAVYDCREVEKDFHARYSCKAKNYIYKIYNRYERNPFFDGRALHYKYPLDEKMLDLCCKQFLGTYDFSAFCSADSSVDDKTRTVFDCSVTRQGDLVTFSVTADGFLYNMVRIMVGTLLDISAKKIEKDKIKDIIHSKNRESAGITASPVGLYLNKVYYEEVEQWLNTEDER